MNNEELNQGISIAEIIDIIRKNLLFIIVTVILTTLLAGVYVKFMVKPKYQSRADVMVQVPVASNDIGYDYLSAQRLVTTMAEFMSKDIIIEKAITESDLDLSLSEIKSGLNVTSSSTSFFINISFTSKNPSETGVVVNAIIDSAIKLVNEDPSFASLKNKISRTSHAGVGVYSSPNKTLYVLIGAFLGAVLSGGYILLKELLNNKFKSKDEIENYLDINVLGIVPIYKIKDGK